MWDGIYHRVQRRATGRGRVSKRTRIQITLETHTVTIIRQGECMRGWCRECADEVEMVGIEWASFLAGLAEPIVRDCPQVQGWHFSTTAAGDLTGLPEFAP
jgi:hypothetical protein